MIKKQFFRIAALSLFFTIIPVHGLFSAGFKNVDVNKIDSDCEYLKKIFSEAAIDISESIDEGLDIDQVIEDIKKEYSKQVKKNKLKMSINDNGIADNRFALSINLALAENLTKPNGHLSINSPYDFFCPFYSYVLYASDIVFEKTGSEYKVYSSGNKNIKQGMLYTGNEENLFKTIINGKVLYRFCIYSNEWMTKTKISLNEKEYKVPVTYKTANVNPTENFSYHTQDDILFVNANSFMWHTEAEKNKIDEATKNIGQIIQDGNINLIVFDLRRNGGGYISCSYYLLGALICGAADENTEEFNEYAKYYNYLHSNEICINTFTSRNRLSIQGHGDGNLTRLLLTKTGEKYPVTDNPDFEYSQTVSPVYKGKIFFITDLYSASSAEDLILGAKATFKDDVIIIGENTRGALDYSNVYQFNLPDSKLAILLSFSDNTKSPLLKESSIWHGDAKGCIPDYWFTAKDTFDIYKIIEVLQ